MKKLVFSSIIAAALICSTSMMAQEVSKKKDSVKPKTELKAEAKKTAKELESSAKTEATKLEKKVAPAKVEKSTTAKTAVTPKAK